MSGELTQAQKSSIILSMENQPLPEPQESEEGVDLSLIRWMLGLSPAERVAHIESVAQSLQELRELNCER